MHAVLFSLQLIYVSSTIESKPGSELAYSLPTASRETSGRLLKRWCERLVRSCPASEWLLSWSSCFPWSGHPPRTRRYIGTAWGRCIWRSGPWRHTEDTWLERLASGSPLSEDPSHWCVLCRQSFSPTFITSISRNRIFTSLCSCLSLSNIMSMLARTESPRSVGDQNLQAQPNTMLLSCVSVKWHRLVLFCLTTLALWPRIAVTTRTDLLVQGVVRRRRGFRTLKTWGQIFETS